jgi:hypothetical protein
VRSAIANAVTTYAQAAGAWSDRDTATIEAQRREIHALNNRLVRSEGALQLIALALGLPADTQPPEIVAEAQRRLR